MESEYWPDYLLHIVFISLILLLRALISVQPEHTHRLSTFIHSINLSCPVENPELSKGLADVPEVEKFACQECGQRRYCLTCPASPSPKVRYQR